MRNVFIDLQCMSGVEAIVLLMNIAGYPFLGVLSRFDTNAIEILLNGLRNNLKLIQM